jgi:hypothetical protein
MSNTLRYKATGRYNLGWLDPRVVFGRVLGGPFNIFEIALSIGKNMQDVDTEVLRNLWLATFGDVPVSHGALTEHHYTGDDIFWVGHELNRRNQIEQIELRFPDRDEVFYGYKLTREE